MALGALLLGAALAAKLVYAILVIAVLAAGPRRAKFRPHIILLLLLPVLPWLVKNYLTTGVPTYPFLAAAFASPDFQARHEAALAAFWGGGGVMMLQGLLETMLKEMRWDHLMKTKYHSDNLLKSPSGGKSLGNFVCIVDIGRKIS